MTMLRQRMVAWCLVAIAATSPLLAAEVKPSPEQIEFFEKSVRPVLLNRCAKCHGEKKVEAGLKLDSKAGLAHGIEGAPVVSPGNVDGSMLIKVVRYDGDTQMPPEGKIPAAEVAALERWVKEGAYWPGDEVTKPSAAPSQDWPARFAAARASHWAFQPVKKPSLPEVKNRDWCQTPIDYFILAKLEAAGLRPAPPAAPRTLLRRLYYDLVGLPPTVEAVEEWEEELKAESRKLTDNATIRDSAAFSSQLSAFDLQLSALLASPHYGERWGRHWLDIARYADTKGYAFTQDRRFPYAYTYRDYVVRAFNEDLPFNQFVVEQLAADLLPAREDNRHLAALGFLTVGRRIGVDDDIDDRIDLVGRGLLGLSVGCARCHDHKYDAIPAEDYYSLYGVFRSSMEPSELPLLGKPEQTGEYLAFKLELDKRQAEYDRARGQEAEKLGVQLRTHVGDFLAAVIVDARGKSNLPAYAYAVAEPRAPVMRHWKEYLKHSLNQPHAVFSIWHRFMKLPTDTFAVEADKLVATLRNNEADPKLPVNGRLRQALLKNPPAQPLDVARLYDELFEQVRQDWTSTLDKAKQSQQPAPTRLDDPAAEELREVLFGSASPAIVALEQVEGLQDPGMRIRLTNVKKKVDEWLATSPGAPARAMVMNDADKPFNPVVYLRGNPGLRGKAVPRQFIGLATSGERKPFPHGSGRLDLAQAIADPQNPLTARVIVNRVWQHHFGQGLVRTPSDFGIRGEPPTHPELLDYLAAWFMEHDWSIKQLQRLIVSSSVWQTESRKLKDESSAPATAQLSALSSQLSTVDPDNRLLAHMNRRRLEFEPLRDSMLVAAGRLETQLGGRPVDLTKPPFTSRRTIYGYIDRQDLPDIFRTFDFASPDVSTEQRPNTTVPQQALFAMNAPFVIEQARQIARRVEATSIGDDPVARIRQLYRYVLSRNPDQTEVELARRFVSQPLLEPTPVWQYGYGFYEADAKQVQFTPFKHFTGKVWQVSEKLPDGKLGYVSLREAGGHPGRNPDVNAVLRWTSPTDGEVIVEGLLAHDTDMGDGVRARAVHQGRVLGEWMVKNSKTPAHTQPLSVRQGDVIDLIVDCRESTAHDSYTWKPTIRQTQGGNHVWIAEKEFHGPAAKGLGPWEMLAQVLLLTNEMAFVD
ncbi:MAG: PSD1 domain-containing protein [Planctomycetaceae bacterium]|nr:PSD1 domain-containing protein [Planctomycetaceae bacterium]